MIPYRAGYQSVAFEVFQFLGQLLQFCLQIGHPGLGALQNVGLCVELLAADHIQARQGGLRQGAGALVHFAPQCAGADQVANLLQDFPGRWGWFQCHLLAAGSVVIHGREFR